MEIIRPSNEPLRLLRARRKNLESNMNKHGFNWKNSVIKCRIAAIAGIPTFKYMISYAIVLYKLFCRNNS